MLRVLTKPRAALTSVVAALALAGALATASRAQAGQYVVDACNGWDSGAPAAVPMGLTAYGANTLFDNNCGIGGGIRFSVFGNQLGAGLEGGLFLTVPADRPNVTISALWTAYDLQARSAGSDAFFEVYGGAQRLSTVIFPPGAGAPAANTPAIDQQPVLPAGARDVHWNILCSTNAATNCVWPSPALYDLLKIRLFLDESVNPTLTVTGGTLLGAGPRSGQQTITFDAADTDSGLAGVTVALDSTVVAQASYACTFTDWSPCPRSQPDSLLTVDTTKVPDGSHVLTVVARDAAGNALTRSAGTVTVANGAVPGIPAGAPNGSGASRLAKLTARYTSTKRSSRRLRFGSRPSVKGTLVDERGNPIGGATIAILARERRSGAVAAPIATARTAADGAYSARLPGGPSRTITFAYTAFGGDAKAAATATLRATVAAVISARISPRSVRAGERITLSGRLALLPRRGVDVKVQARQGQTWRTIDEVRTARDGSFRWRYRFAATQARRAYAFRARVSSQVYPFATGNSKPVLVRVR